MRDEKNYSYLYSYFTITTMARILKNGNLSGAVGNLVFVNTETQNYVRTKPSHLKQSQKTKAAAAAFGVASAKDKLYRHALLEQFALLTDRMYAARHRARMAKALRQPAEENSENGNLHLGLPESLTGFDFNSQFPWEKITHFYPIFKQLNTHQLQCMLPPLQLGKEIRLPQGIKSAELRLDAFTVNPMLDTVQVNVLSTYSIEVSRVETSLPALWTVDIPESPAWLIVLGTIIFQSNTPQMTGSSQGNSTYLFAKSTGAN